MTGQMVPATALAVGDVVMVDHGWDGLPPVPRVVTRVDWTPEYVSIRYGATDGTDLVGYWVVGIDDEVELVRVPRAVSLSSRVLLRGVPWFTAVAAIAVVAAVVGAPRGGGAGFLIVVLWLVAVVRMATTPEDRR